MREFTTSVRAVDAGGGTGLPDVAFKLDGTAMTCRAPKQAQLAYLIAAAAAGRSQQDQVAAILDFFEQTLDDPSLRVFKRRLLDSNDPFDFTDAMAIFEHVCKEWAGRPPGSASASSPSP